MQGKSPFVGADELGEPATVTTMAGTQPQQQVSPLTAALEQTAWSREDVILLANIAQIVAVLAILWRAAE